VFVVLCFRHIQCKRVCAGICVCIFVSLLMCVSVCVCACVRVCDVSMSDVMCLCASRCVCMLRPCVSVCLFEFVLRYTYVPKTKNRHKR